MSTDRGARAPVPRWTTRHFGRVLVVCGAAAISFATLTPSAQPQMPLSFCLACGELGGVDVLLNVLLFLPLGTGLAMSGVSRRRALGMMCTATVVIELLQLFFIRGRDASLGDVLSNSTGGALGFYIGRHVYQLLWPSRKNGPRLAAAAGAAWIFGTTMGCFALLPSPTDSRYFGQLARQLGAHPAYTGRILAASVANARFPDEEFPDALSVARALRAGPGARTELVIVLHRGTADPRAIARIADADQNEILQVGEQANDLLFAVRTYAPAFRMRPIVLRMPSALRAAATAGQGDDTLRIAAEYVPPRARMSVRIGFDARHAVLPLTPAQAWRVIAPAQVDIDGSLAGATLDACFLFLVALPLGYWAAASGWNDPITRVSLGIVSVSLILGLAEGPLLFRLATARWWEVIGQVAGVACGSGLALIIARHRLPVGARAA